MPDPLTAVAKAIRDEVNAVAIGPADRMDATCAENAARAAMLALAEMELPEDALNRGADVLLMAETERGETFQDDCREIFRIICRALAHPTDDGDSVGG